MTQITSSELQATDVDSDDDLLTFTVMTALSIGAILKDNEDIRIGKRVFTQLDINQGILLYLFPEITRSLHMIIKHFWQAVPKT